MALLELIRGRSVQISLRWATVLVLALCARSAHADPCKLDVSSGLLFGTYDPLSPVARNSAGFIGYSCPPGRGGPEISISQGIWGTFAARAMKNASGDAALLRYKLCPDATCQVLWGDGSAGTTVQIGPGGKNVILHVFGEIPALQNVASGLFSDSVTVTFNF